MSEWMIKISVIFTFSFCSTGKLFSSHTGEEASDQFVSIADLFLCSTLELSMVRGARQVWVYL